MESEAQSSPGEAEIEVPTSYDDDDDVQMEGMVNERSQSEEGKEDEEEATSDGDFIKIEKELIDAKESSGSLKPVAEVEENPCAQGLVSICSTSELTEQVKALELRLEIVAKELQASESEKAILNSEIDLTNEKLDIANNRCEELEIVQRRLNNEIFEAEHRHSRQLETLHEALEAVEAKKNELVDVTESFNALSAEMENSKKKAEELELQLASSENLALKFEELCNERGSHAELQSRRALETEEMLEIEKLRVRETEVLLGKLQEEMKVLSEKIAENSRIEEALARTTSEMSEIQENLVVSKLQTAGLENKLASSEAVIEELNEVINLHKASEDQLRAHVQSLNDLLSTSNEDILDKIAKLELIESKLHEEVEKRATFEASLISQEGHTSALQEELVNLRIQNKTLEGNLDSLKENMSIANDLCKELEEKINLANANHDDKNTQLSLALSHNEELMQNLKSLEGILEESKTSAETVAERNLELHGLVQASNAAEVELKLQLETVELQLESAQNHNNKLDEELALAEERSINAHKQIHELEVKLVELSTSLRGAEEEKSLSNCQFQAYEDRVQQLESSLSVSYSRNKEIEQQMKDLADQCSEHENMAGTSRQRSLELEDLLHMSHSRAEDAGKKVEELELNLEDASGNVRELEKKLSSVEAKHRDAEAEAKQHCDKVSEVSAELATVKATTACLEAIIEASNEKERDLTDMLNTVLKEKQTFEDLSNNLSEKIVQADNLIETLKSELTFAQENLETAEKDLEASSIRETEILEKLKVSGEHIEHHARVAEQSTARSLELESLHESLAKDSDLKLSEALERFSLKEHEARELHEKVSLLEEQEAFHQYQAIEVSEKVASFRAELDANAIKFIALENTIDDLRQQIGQAEVQAEQSYSENELLLETNLKLKNELESHQQKVNEIHGLLTSIQGEKEAISEQLASQVKALAALSEEHSRGLEEHATTESRIKETELQLMEALEKFSQRDKDAMELDEKLFAIETQVSTHEEEAKDAATVAELQKFQLEESALKLLNLEKILEEITHKATQYEADNVGLIQYNLSLSQELEKCKANSSELQATLDEVKDEKEHLSTHLDFSRKTEEDLMQQLASNAEKLQSQMSFIVSENNTLNEVYQNTKTELQGALAEMEERINGHKEREISLTAEVNDLKENLMRKEAVEARMKELEKELLLVESRCKEEIKVIQSAAEDTEAKLHFKTEEHANVVRERDTFIGRITELHEELQLAQGVVAAQDTEASEKLALLRAELEELRRKPHEVLESKQEVSVLEHKLVSSTHKSVQQVHDGFADAAVKGEPEVKSRDIDFGGQSATLSKRKNKGKGAKAVVALADDKSSSSATAAATAEPSGAMALKFMIGVAIVSMIIGVILGKRY